MLKVVKVTAGISPRVDTVLMPRATTTATFTISLSGYEVEAVPHPGIDIEPDPAIERLYEEGRPLLAAASYFKGQPLKLVDANPNWIDTNDPEQRLVRRPVGTGLATAKRAIEPGHAVLAAGRDESKFASAQAVGAQTAQLDAGDRAATELFFEMAGEFDHLVLCASGASGAGSFRELDLESIRKGFEGKFWPQVTSAHAALSTLRPGGSITFVGAISSRALKPGTAGLAAINAALEAMVPILASELRPTRVNIVVPGVVDTPWWSRVPDAQRKELFEQLAHEVPMGRIGTPQDLASAILFVTTNTFITGTVLDCDGGWKLKNE